MIKAENLTKRFGSVFALDSVSFEIGEGEIVGLLGENGAGKSTTMNIITGYLSASEGSVSVNGRDIEKEPTAAKASIGYLPEQPPLYPDMTVREYLNFVYDLKKCKFDREAHLSEICDAVKIRDVENRLIGHLSKGYKQRVGIAQTLIGNPPVLIFDEPTVGLDPKQIIEVRSLIRTLGKKHTVILSTHILPEVQAVCERIIIINKGKIIADKKTNELTRTINDSLRYKVKICGPLLEITEGIKSISSVTSIKSTGERDADSFSFTVESKSGADVRREIFNLCTKKGWPLLEISPVAMELEEIFINLIENKPAEEAGGRRTRRKVQR